MQGEQRRVDLHRQILAAAERAADPREVNPDLLLRQSETGRDLLPVDVQPLRRDIDVDPPSPSGTASPDSGPRNAWSWLPIS